MCVCPVLSNFRSGCPLVPQSAGLCFAHCHFHIAKTDTNLFHFFVCVCFVGWRRQIHHQAVSCFSFRIRIPLAGKSSNTRRPPTLQADRPRIMYGYADRIGTWRTTRLVFRFILELLDKRRNAREPIYPNRKLDEWIEQRSGHYPLSAHYPYHLFRFYPLFARERCTVFACCLTALKVLISRRTGRSIVLTIFNPNAKIKRVSMMRLSDPLNMLLVSILTSKIRSAIIGLSVHQAVIQVNCI